MTRRRRVVRRGRGGSRWVRAGSLALLAAVAVPASACRGALGPEGSQAGRIADLAWVLIAVSAVVFVLVMVVLAIAVVRKPKESDDQDRERLILIGGGGLVLPAIVLFAVIGLTVDTLHDLTKPAPAGALRLQITGHDFWWDVVYPDLGVRTANEIHIPAGETVEVTGTSVDVIHSFWAPEIAGKMDLIPGKENTFKLRGDKPGVYRGQCAEFCGLSHANMAFFLIVEPRDEFSAWIESQQTSPAALVDARSAAGREVFFGNSCAACHGLSNDVEGAAAAPNLGHLATRDTIGAGELSLTESNLERWVRDPEHVKPGVNMPSYDRLSDEDLAALVQFLLSLD